MKLISLITLALRTTLIFFFSGSEREEKARVRPDKAHIKTSTYYMCDIYRKFYSSRCVAIYVCILFIWKPELLLCLIGLTFWGWKSLWKQIKGLYRRINKKHLTSWMLLNKWLYIFMVYNWILKCMQCSGLDWIVSLVILSVFLSVYTQMP